MQPMVDILRGVLDPRGRADRFGYFVTMTVAAVFGQGLMLSTGPLDLVTLNVVQSSIYAFVLWIYAVPNMRRLHDLGYSGWLFWAALPSTFIWSVVAFFCVAGVINVFGGDVFSALQTGRPLYWVLFAVIMSPLFAASMWLCCKKSVATSNMYGARPVQFGMSWPEREEPIMAPVQTAVAKAGVTGSQG
jgi:uncharacterized membrane protein YhaH (DUF805 family)